MRTARWRGDHRIAAKILGEAFPDRQDYDLVLKQLEDSIHCAESVAPYAYATTLFGKEYGKKRNGFRLNMGGIEALTAFDGRVRLLMHKLDRDTRGRLHGCIERSRYKSVPGDNFIFAGTVEQFRQHRQAILRSHHDFIEAAGTTKSGKPVAGTRHQSSHSPGLIALIGSK